MLLFENFNGIHSICKKYGIMNYKINSDFSINVRGNVDLRHKGLTKIPLKFNKVSGYFNCSFNKLTSLNGSPKEVDTFICQDNLLTSLEGTPKEVGKDFYCKNNQLTSLKGYPQKVTDFYFPHNQLTSLESGPKKIDGTYDCSWNKLISLEGSPEELNTFLCSNNKLKTLKGGPKRVNIFDCSNNQLTTLEGCPEEIEGGFMCVNNPIYSIYVLFKYDLKLFKQLLEDYNYIRGNRIIKHRFAEACIDAGIEMPEKIEGYDII